MSTYHRPKVGQLLEVYLLSLSYHIYIELCIILYLLKDSCNEKSICNHQNLQKRLAATNHALCKAIETYKGIIDCQFSLHGHHSLQEVSRFQ